MKWGGHSSFELSIVILVSLNSKVSVDGNFGSCFKCDGNQIAKLFCPNDSCRILSLLVSD